MADLDDIDADRKEAYFLRFNLLLVKYGTEVLKDVFNWKIPPDTLHTELQNRRQTINYCKTKLNVITKRQEAKLYPQYHAPTSNDFDISLLVTLLRHICPGFNKGQTIKNLWEENDNTKIQVSPNADNDIRTVADIVRIRNTRNMMQHKNLASLEQNVFEDTWNEVADVIERLGNRCNKTDYKQKIEDLKTRSLELVSPYVISLRHQSVCFFKEYNDEQARYFIETEQYRKAAKLLHDRNVVVLTGHPGEGKTTMALKLALDKTQGRNCLMLKQPRDWREVDWSLKLFDTIIIDDIFGAGSLDHRLLDEWNPYLSEIERHSKQKRLRVIITTRHYIFEESLKDNLDTRIEMFKGEPIEKKAIVHLTSQDLTKKERTDILQSQANRNKIELSLYIIQDCVDASMTSPLDMFPLSFKYRREEFAFGFPECASMFVRNHSMLEMLERGSEFFRKPAALFKRYLEELISGREQEKQDKFLSLVAVWASESKGISEKDIQNPRKASDHVRRVVDIYYGKNLDNELLENMQKSLESHSGGFLAFHESTGEYSFNHNVIGDMVGVVVGKKKPIVAVELCPRDFLMEHVKIADAGERNEFMIVLHERHYSDLAEKFANMIMRRNCNSIHRDQPSYEFSQLERRGPRSNTIQIKTDIDYGIIKHRAFKNEKFVKAFVEHVIKEDLVPAIFSVPVMKMTGYFLDYGITLKEMTMCLLGYAIYSKESVFGNELLNQDLLEGNHMEPTLSLLLATHAREKDTMRRLLSKGAKVTGDTIYVAAHKNDVEVLQILVNHPGININDKGNAINGNYPLIVISRKNMTVAMQCLLEHGADPSVKNDKKLTALHKAAIYKHVDITKLLLKHKAPLNEKGGKFKRTPLHIAADQGSTDIVQLLLDKGASVKVKDHRGHYPIHLAAIRGNCETVRALLEHDKTQDNLRIASYGKKSFIKGMSVFHVAVWKENQELLKVLVDTNADPNVKDFYGQTPLMFAILTEKKKIARLLLIMPAVNKSMQQKQGFTPLHAAIHKGNDRVACALMAEVNINTKDKYGRTPLHVACEKANIYIANILLVKYKADPRMVTKRGDTVFHILRRKKKNSNREDHIKRRTIEVILGTVDPTFKQRLPEMPNRGGIVISDRPISVTGVENNQIEANIRKLKLDDPTESSDDEEKTIPKRVAQASLGRNRQDLSDDDYGSNYLDDISPPESDGGDGLVDMYDLDEDGEDYYDNY